MFLTFNLLNFGFLRNQDGGAGGGTGAVPGAGAAPPAGAGTPPPAAAPGAGGVPGSAPPAPPVPQPTAQPAPPPAAPPTPAPGVQPTFSETFEPGPVRDLMQQKGYTSAADLGNAYWHLSQLQSGAADVVAIPGENATPEQIATFNQKMGVPGSAAEYRNHVNLEGVQNMSDDMFNFTSELFHEIGVPASKMQAAIDKWGQFAAVQTQKAAGEKAQLAEAEMAQLKTKLGDQFDEQLAQGQQAVQALGLNAELRAKIADSLGSSAALFELMQNIGQRMSGGGLTTTPTIPNNAPTDPAAAQAKIDQLMADETFLAAYNDPNNATHKERVREMERLYAIVYPTPAAPGAITG